MESSHIQRQEPLVIHLERLGKWFIIQPPTRAQVRETLALDPDLQPGEVESSNVIDDRVARQAAILARDARECKPEIVAGKIVSVEELESPLPFDELRGDEERKLLTALIAWHHGLDPRQSLAVAAALKKKAIVDAISEIARNGLPTSTATRAPSPSNSDAREGCETLSSSPLLNP